MTETRPVRMLSTVAARLTLVSVLVALSALMLAGYTLSTFFRDNANRKLNDELTVLVEAMVGAAELDREGVIRFNHPLFDARFNEPYSGWYWEVAEEGMLPFRSRSLWDFEIILDPNDSTPNVSLHPHDGPDGQVLRVAEIEVRLPEAPDRRFRFVAAADTRALLANIEQFDELLIQLLVLITVAIGAALALQVFFALKPLKRMTDHLAQVRSGKRMRMSTTYPEDIQPLADEIDALLDHKRALIDRARTHVGNLAHAIKTPITIMRNELNTMDDDRAQRISRPLDDMARQIDQHLRRARVAGGGPGAGVDVKDRLHKTVRAIDMLYRDKGLEILCHCDASLVFDGEEQDFDEIIGNLVENAGKWAATKVSVEAREITRPGGRPRLEVRIDDDGPGVPEEERPALFERGKRLDESVPGTGLGLAIVAEIVDLYGGTASLDESPLGGLMVLVMLPAKPAA